jgi:putative CRISPR-associated protein (TIGR02620 family)
MSSKRKPTKYFVTRHRGAITWAAEGGVRASKIEMEHFDVRKIGVGDVVMGTLPVHLASAVCERGGEYWHLAMDIPPEARGRELTAEDMRNYGARLEAFLIQGLGTRLSSTPEVAEGPESNRPVLHVCIVTGETMANLLPLMHLQWTDVALIVSESMQWQAEHLTMLANGIAEARGRAGIARVVSKQLRRTAPLREVRAAMLSIAGQIRKEFPGHDVVVNWTGGLKLMALGALEAFRPFARLLYCDTSAGMLEAVWPPSGRSEPLPANLTDVETFLFAQGHQTARRKDLSPAGVQAMRLRQRVTATLMLEADRHLTGARRGASANRQLDRFLHDLAWRALPKEARRNEPGQPFQPEQTAAGINAASMALTTMLDTLIDTGLLADWYCESGQVTLEFASEEAATYLAGGYAEEFVALSMLSLDLPEGQVASNVGIDVLRPSKQRLRGELNELDAVLVWRNRILLVECKAGLQFLQGKSQEALNKLAALRNMVGPFGEAWLVSKVPFKPEFNADALDRMAMYRIPGIAGADMLRQLPMQLARWAGVPTGTGLIDWSQEVLTLGRPQALAKSGRR